MEDLEKRVEAAEERWQEKITVTTDEAINEAISVMQGVRKDLDTMAPVTSSGALAVEHKKKHLDLCMKKLETLRANG